MESLSSRPAPETFLKTAAKLAIEPSRCVVVEDAVQGIQVARAAQMKVIAVTTTRKREDLTKADLIVDHLAELTTRDFLELLEGCNA